MEVPEGRKSRQAKKQVSDEYLGSLILEYLVKRDEEGRTGCTAYEITHKARNFPTTQRQQRIDRILELLVRRGFVHCDPYETARFYKITEIGKKWYKEIVKSFYSVFDGIYLIR